MIDGFWDDFPDVREDLIRVRDRMKKALEKAPEVLRSELAPLLQNGGKTLRPALLLLAARSGDRQPRLDDLAAAVEILHTATLIHDDILDEASTRRHRPAYHREVGLSKAILYGDLLYAYCFRLVSESANLENAQALSKIVLTMAGAELLQKHEAFQPHESLRRSLKKIMGKTAAFFSLCLYIGARESGQTEADCQRYRRAGYSLGMAFQIRDDILDFIGSEATLGKPPTWDLRHGIFTLPVVMALKNEALQSGRDRELAGLLATLSDRPDLLGQAASLITSLQGLRSAERLANHYTTRVRRELEALAPDPWRQTLLRLVDRLLIRDR